MTSYTTVISIYYIGGTRKVPFVLSSTTLTSMYCRRNMENALYAILYHSNLYVM